MSVDQEATVNYEKCGYSLNQLSDDFKEVQADYEQLMYRLHCLVNLPPDKLPIEQQKWLAEIESVVSDAEFNITALGDKLAYIKIEISEKKMG